MSDLRDRIRAARDARPAASVEVPEWGDTLYVRRLTAAELLEWEAWLETRTGSDVAKGIATMARLVRLATVDAEGGQVFTEDDESWLPGRSIEVLERLFDAAAGVNKMRPADRDAIRKNSPGAGGSPTASPSPSVNGTSPVSSAG